MATVPKSGQLVCDNPYGDPYDVRGAEGDLRDAGNATGMSPGAPVWTEGRSIDTDAVNALGSITADTGSDPMFDRFKHETIGDGALDNRDVEPADDAPDRVVSSALPGADSDSMFERYPNAGSAS